MISFQTNQQSGDNAVSFSKTVRLVLTLAMLAVSSLSIAATEFQKMASVAGESLVINGSGTRYKAIFKVYDMAMYLPKATKSPEGVLALPGAKKLSFVAQRKVSGTDLGLAFMRGLKDNNSREQMRKHVVETTRLIDIFSGKPYVEDGQTFAMDFIPGKGTQFFIQGEAQGDPVGDAEFFQMVLRIWLGESPADWRLKAALLGG
jgi:hypothetical protein